MRLAPRVPFVFLASGFLSLACQQVLKAPPTLRVNSREVLIDVVVTDNHGNPVIGLQKSAFQVFDKGQPQTINSFEAHTGGILGEFDRTGSRNNAISAAEVPSARNILLIDTSRMDIVDQMSLYKQAVRFIQNLPPKVPLAVFWRSFEYPVLLQDFTTDHVLLEAAIAKAVPHFQKFPAGLWAPEAADYLGPQRVADYLSQIPGRKNLLWLIGGTGKVAGSPALANAGVSQDPGATSVGLRQTYALLQKSRVALYPIDVRGLRPDLDLREQHLRETQFAEDTGGEAFYNLNDVAKSAERALDEGNNFYTLAYSPSDLHGDGSWHDVRLNVDGGRFQLSYRRGYYDDPAPGSRPATAEAKPMIQVAHSEIAEPNGEGPPLVFRAQAAPAASGTLPSKRGERAWRIHYDVAAEEIQHGFTNGTATAEVGAAIIAINVDGRIVDHVSQKVSLSFAEAAYKAAPRSALSFDQLIDLPSKGQIFLYIALWDAATGRMGTIDLSLDGRGQ